MGPLERVYSLEQLALFTVYKWVIKCLYIGFAFHQHKTVTLLRQQLNMIPPIMLRRYATRLILAFENQMVEQYSGSMYPYEWDGNRAMLLYYVKMTTWYRRFPFSSHHHPLPTHPCWFNNIVPHYASKISYYMGYLKLINLKWKCCCHVTIILNLILTYAFFYNFRPPRTYLLAPWTYQEIKVFKKTTTWVRLPIIYCECHRTQKKPLMYNYFY